MAKDKGKMKIELVYKENKKSSEERSYTGYVSLNGQHFRFWNLTYDGMLYIFERNINWFLEYVMKERSKMTEKKGD